MCKYERGNYMTFPLEYTENREESAYDDQRYLLPSRIASLQELVMDACDRMEYDGSLMYDCHPDKISIERLVKNLCEKAEASTDCTILMQVLLCREMECRRHRRKRHKEAMKKN